MPMLSLLAQLPPPIIYFAGVINTNWFFLISCTVGSVQGIKKRPLP